MVARRKRTPLLFHNRTDIGCVRAKNEDYLGYYSIGRRSLFLVADGMGGEAGGAEASRLAVEHAAACFQKDPDDDPVNLLRAMFASAQTAVLAGQRENAELENMGTTMEVVLVDSGRAWLGHVGDSRILLVRKGRCQALTADHTLVQKLVDDGMITAEDAKEHPMRHVLQKVVGKGDSLEPDITTEPLNFLAGDVLLMCTDGLSDLVDMDEMAAVARHYDPKRACDKFVEIARNRGAHDNVTVQVIHFGSQRAAWRRLKTINVLDLKRRPERAQPWFKRTRWRAAAALAVALITAAGGLWVLHERRGPAVSAANPAANPAAKPAPVAAGDAAPESPASNSRTRAPESVRSLGSQPGADSERPPE